MHLIITAVLKSARFFLFRASFAQIYLMRGSRWGYIVFFRLHADVFAE